MNCTQTASGCEDRHADPQASRRCVQGIHRPRSHNQVLVHQEQDHGIRLNLVADRFPKGPQEPYPDH
jgi:hypothetical protein